jgi:hypothetical protein
MEGGWRTIGGQREGEIDERGEAESSQDFGSAPSLFFQPNRTKRLCSWPGLRPQVINAFTKMLISIVLREMEIWSSFGFENT